MKHLVGVAVIGSLVMIGAAAISANDKPMSGSTTTCKERPSACQAPTTAAASNPASDITNALNHTCVNDWHLCKDNEELVHAYVSKVKYPYIDCEMAAEKLAKYGKPTWPLFAFEHFLTGNEYTKTGKMVLVEPDAQFENGFGGKPHVKVFCTYDLNSMKIVDIDLVQL